jgi:hypothetical protein
MHYDSFCGGMEILEDISITTPVTRDRDSEFSKVQCRSISEPTRRGRLFSLSREDSMQEKWIISVQASYGIC